MKTFLKTFGKVVGKVVGTIVVVALGFGLMEIFLAGISALVYIPMYFYFENLLGGVWLGLVLGLVVTILVGAIDMLAFEFLGLFWKKLRKL